MTITFPLLICVLEELSSLNFAFNHNDLVIAMVLTRAKSAHYISRANLCT